MFREGTNWRVSADKSETQIYMTRVWVIDFESELPRASISWLHLWAWRVELVHALARLVLWGLNQLPTRLSKCCSRVPTIYQGWCTMINITVANASLVSSSLCYLLPTVFFLDRKGLISDFLSCSPPILWSSTPIRIKTLFPSPWPSGKRWYHQNNRLVADCHPRSGFW